MSERRAGGCWRAPLAVAVRRCGGNVLGAATAQAQLRAMTGAPQPVSRDQPVFYQADAVEYDRDGAMVTLIGHVEIWQGDRILRADRVTYDRNTGVAAATGNVVLVEPDGQVLFAEYAELSEGMKNGVLRDLRALLPQNGRLAANGARRTDATINELSRAIYTTCNLCNDDPSAPPLWDIRARSAVQDIENKKIEYTRRGGGLLRRAGLLFPVPRASRSVGAARQRHLDAERSALRAISAHSLRCRTTGSSTASRTRR